ncbi:MAG: hypothetical protein FWE02_06915 [Defluviitaleaceae bacterium]|nr:hypothetical protein [Defluviitaleaceae bacterium]
MKGMILEKGQRYYTNLQMILKNLNGFHKQFNWLITNYECYPEHEKHVKLLTGSPLWISGKDLDEMMMVEEFQWTWGVLSAFKAGITKEEALRYDEPESQSVGFWKNPISIQHPLAEIEIVPWDSMLVLFISKDEEYTLLFKEKFPDAQDLEEHNKEIYDNNNPI